MRKASMFLVATALPLLMAAVARADGPQYVGPSSTPRIGDGGYLALHQDCALAYRGSTMCTSKMIIEGGAAPKAPVPTASGEWVNPVIVASDGTDLFDYSGVHADYSEALNCYGWNDPGGSTTGLTIANLANGFTFQTRNCDVARPVACCR